MSTRHEGLLSVRCGSQEAADSGAQDLEELVQAARRGEEGAWRQLHARYTPRMRAQARSYRLGSSDVDEVVQFAWAQCFEHRHRIRSASALPAWLLSTCRHRALRVLREQRRCAPSEEVPEIPRPDLRPDGPLDVLLARERADALVEALRDLSERQRGVITALLSLDGTGDAYRRIAEQLAMPVGSIGPTRQRAVARLREVLGPSLAA